MTAVLDVSEAALKTQVIELAHTLGWRVAHFRPARTKHGWRTPVEGDGDGFPDLVLVRDRVILAELKSRTGKPTPEQQGWLDAAAKAGAGGHLWRPDDLQAIANTLAPHTRRHHP